MIGPEHSHDFEASLIPQPHLATAAVDAQQDATQPASVASTGPSLASNFTMSRSSSRSSTKAQPSVRTVLLSLISASPAAMAVCIPLQGSTACSAFQAASVSTDSFLVGLLYVNPRRAMNGVTTRPILWPGG